MENNLYSWTFEDNKNRSASWYIIFLSIMIWLVLWGFLTKQYGMSFVIILLSWLMYFIDNNSDDIVSVEIHELWIKIADQFYDYAKIKEYAFIYHGEYAQHLRLKLQKSPIPQIDLDINNQIASDLRSFLSEYISEAEDTELSFIEKTIKILKL